MSWRWRYGVHHEATAAAALTSCFLSAVSTSCCPVQHTRFLCFVCSVVSLCARGRGVPRSSTRGGLWVNTSSSSSWTLMVSWSKTTSPHLETGSHQNTGSPPGLRHTRYPWKRILNRTKLDQTGPTHCHLIPALWMCVCCVRGKPRNLFTFSSVS